MANGRFRLVPNLVVLILSVLATLGVLKYWGKLEGSASSGGESNDADFASSSLCSVGIPDGGNGSHCSLSSPTILSPT